VLAGERVCRFGSSCSLAPRAPASPPLSAMEGVMENGENRAVDSVKLFVGQLPKQMNEQQLAEVFSEAGTVYEINIIKDKLTKQSRGCCFLMYTTRQEADKAIEIFHNKRTLQPVASPLQVKYADGEMERLEHKLFIGMLPKGASKADVMTVFSPYGTIKELSVIKGSQPTSKGEVHLLVLLF
jgi:CUG-BP- and ETR3-like factor